VSRAVAALLALLALALACGKYGPPERPPRDADPAAGQEEEEGQ